VLGTIPTGNTQHVWPVQRTAAPGAHSQLALYGIDRTLRDGLPPGEVQGITDRIAGHVARNGHLSPDELHGFMNRLADDVQGVVQRTPAGPDRVASLTALAGDPGLGTSNR
jgi:hypothetical protein